MTSPRLNHIVCPHPEGQHRMAYWSWGPEDAPQVLVCVHGLTRQGRDFDRLAQGLIARAGERLLVVCPDVAGRGHSDWLPGPQHYQIPQYAADMMALLATLAAAAPRQHLDWVGTSMGGLIGMALAGQTQFALPLPIRRLVLNDVGPAITWSSVQRMQQYVGLYGRYADLNEAAAELRRLSVGFGPVPEDIWRELCMPMLRPHPKGGLTLHYDPAIGEAVRQVTPEAAQAGEAAMWALYDQIRARTLLIRGAESDLLTVETARAMTERGPRAQWVQWPGLGHAPTLTAPDQIEAVAAFLLDDRA